MSIVPWSERAKKIKLATTTTILFSVVCFIILTFLMADNTNPFIASIDAIKYFINITRYIIFEGSFWEFQNTNLTIYIIGFLLLIAYIGLLICLFLFIEIHYILDKYGESRFASKQDIQKMGLFNKNSLNLILGKFKGKAITSPVCRHTMAVAPTRSGKTAGLVIPNILQFNGSQIVIDPKGELFDTTSLAMAKKGYKVRCIEWSNPQSKDTWSPVDLKTLPQDTVELEKAIDRLSAALYPKSKGDNAFFDDQARINFSSLMMFEVLEARRKKLEEDLDIDISISTVLSFLTETLNQNISLKESSLIGVNEDDKAFPLARALNSYIKKALKYHYPKRIIEDLSGWVGLGEKTAGNVAGTITSKATQFRSEALKKTMSKSSFTFEDLRKEKTALYIKFPQKDAKAYGQCTSLLLEFFFAYAVDTKKAKTEHEILIIADEFASLPAIPLMNEFLSKGAGMGTIIMIILQDFSQAIEIYGKNIFDSMKSNCSYMIIFAQNNLDVQKEVSSLIGNKTIRESLKEIDKKEGLSLIRAEDIGSIPFGQHLLIVANYHNRPITADTPLYFEDKDMCKILGIKPTKRKD